MLQISALGARFLYTTNQIIYYWLFIISAPYFHEKNSLKDLINAMVMMKINV